MPASGTRDDTWDVSSRARSESDAVRALTRSGEVALQSKDIRPSYAGVTIGDTRTLMPFSFFLHFQGVSCRKCSSIRRMSRVSACWRSFRQLRCGSCRDPDDRKSVGFEDPLDPRDPRPFLAAIYGGFGNPSGILVFRCLTRGILRILRRHMRRLYAVKGGGHSSFMLHLYQGPAYFHGRF